MAWRSGPARAPRRRPAASPAVVVLGTAGLWLLLVGFGPAPTPMPVADPPNVRTSAPALGAVALGWVTWTDGEDEPVLAPRSGPVPGAEPVRTRPAPPPPDEGPELPPVVARVADLDLLLPAARVLSTGFHEAAGPNGIEMQPVGTLTGNLNTSKFDPPDDDAAGAAYHVMASRGREFAATSALDVLLEDDEPVLSPVTGVVADVRGMLVYGEYPDLRIEVRPDHPDELRVVIIHVDGIRVEPGDRVEAGVTVLADTARRFPFLSQIDNETYPELWPHVHLEVQARDASRPGGTRAAIDPAPDPEDPEDLEASAATEPSSDG